MKKRYFVPADYNGVYESSNKGPIFLAHCHNRDAARLIARALNEMEERKAKCESCGYKMFAKSFAKEMKRRTK